MCLDIHCAAILKANGDFYSWLVQFAVTSDVDLNKSEFINALNYGDVDGTIEEKEEVFAYFEKR